MHENGQCRIFLAINNFENTKFKIKYIWKKTWLGKGQYTLEQLEIRSDWGALECIKYVSCVSAVCFCCCTFSFVLRAQDERTWFWCERSLHPRALPIMLTDLFHTPDSCSYVIKWKNSDLSWRHEFFNVVVIKYVAYRACFQSCQLKSFS